jgi:hypothetical protein
VSARVLGDLGDPAEMAAVREIERLHTDGTLKRVTSKMSTIEHGADA